MEARHVDRFWSRVDKSGKCWLWTGGLNDYGYGRMSLFGRYYMAHRLAYEMERGPIPADRFVDHKCRVRACVNLAHLRLVTAKQNQENRSADRTSKTGIRGVNWHVRAGKWRVEVTSHGVHHYMGLFTDIAEAERVAIATRNRLFTHNEEDKQHRGGRTQATALQP